MRRPGWAVLALPLLVALPASEALAAIAFVKNVGTNGTTTTGTTLAVTVPAGGVAVNDTVVISFAMDPASGTVSAADARGNTYTTDADFQQGTSGSGTGVRQVLLSARLGTALVAGNTITVTHPSVAARAMSVSEFSGLAATAMLDRTSVNSGTSTTPTSNATAATTQADELLVGAIGAETDTSESFTVGASYAALPRSPSGTGGTLTNQVAANPEYRIVSATGAYTATGTLGVQRRWAAVIATYRAARCGNAAVEPGEQCDDGNTASGDCCSPTCLFESAGTICRASAGVCDVVESCTGTSGTCPANQLVAAGTTCRAVAGVCDVAETCSGASVTCPADVLAAAGTTCRASTGPCDPAETCTGASSACPADQLAAAGTTCRAAAGACDVAETCTGTSGACPANTFVAPGTVCRASAGGCDVAEACTGASAACPNDAFVAAGTVCRASAGTCDVAESCTGSSPTCPADQLVAAGTTCRAAAGVCDLAETCSGTSVACPADAKSTAVCRPSAGACDVAEACDGAANACPTDGFSPASTICRPAVGACDVAELCPGTGGSCPADVLRPAGIVCRAASGACDVTDHCSGTDGACPAEVIAAGVECRAAAGPCDVAELCDGSLPGCPADLMKPSTVECRPPVAPCDAAETCTGTSTACPPDVLSTGVCRPSVGGCDPAERCDGTSLDCPADGLESAGTLCRAAADECDRVEACTGTSAACPPDIVQRDGVPCSDGDRCTFGDVCHGGVCTGTTPDGPCPDALFCYKAKPASRFDPFLNYNLVDDFEDRYFDVTKPRGLCQAAAADGEPVTGPTRRLAGYAMRSASGILARQTDVRVVNDIGAVTLNTGKPDIVRVPASVPNAPPDPNGGIDHYKCYKVFIAAGTPKLQHGIRVQVGDGFTSPPKMLELLKPAHLCMPADADSQGVQERNIVQLCYATRPAKGEPRHVPQIGVQLDDEFGSLVLDTVKELELCIPSVRVVP